MLSSLGAKEVVEIIPVVLLRSWIKTKATQTPLVKSRNDRPKFTCKAEMKKMGHLVRAGKLVWSHLLNWWQRWESNGEPLDSQLMLLTTVLTERGKVYKQVQGPLRAVPRDCTFFVPQMQKYGGIGVVDVASIAICKHSNNSEQGLLPHY